MKGVMLGGALIVMLIASCQEKPATKRSGVEIDFLKTGNGEVPRHGDVLSLNMTYSSDGEELFNTAKIGAPVQIRFDTSQWKRGGMLYEVLELLEIGDSVAFEIPAKNLYEVSFQSVVPDSVDANSKIEFRVGLDNILARESVFENQLAQRLEHDARIIENYFAEKGITGAATTESGLRYIIHKEGIGPKPETGQIVSVHYEGTLLNGKVFDSSYGRDPFEFYLGYGRVIPGWDEFVAMMNVGTKATLYIPSPLGYGERGAGRTIRPNTVLKFDMELVDIEGAPAN